MSPRFSERIGAVKADIQIGSINAPLRNSIWNFIIRVLPEDEGLDRYQAVELIAEHVLRVPTQRVDVHADRWLLAQVEKMSWAEVYDLLEWVLQNAEAFGQMTQRAAAEEANAILAREHSGYRVIAGEIAPITSPTEIAEIEDAMSASAESGLSGARQQLEQAVRLFGRRPAPDYRNAIKEAISAVESVVKVINGTRGGGLHAALETVSAKIEMHPALKAGLEKLYGYTSDRDGIRHAILEEANVDEADARFMIVTCSAFVNFLIVRSEAAGLLSQRRQ